VGKSEPLYPAGKNLKWCAVTVENSLAVPQKIKITMSLRNFTPSYVPVMVWIESALQKVHMLRS
jgi:hypothetical protein